MRTQLQLGDLPVDVVRKSIKNIHLSVHPPTGRVTISAPNHLNLDTIRVFAITKLPWIRQQQAKLLSQDRESPREFLNRESHYVWGKRYLLKLIEEEKPPSVELSHSTLTIKIRPGCEVATRKELLDGWYREQVKREVPDLLAKWERLIGVKVSRIFVQKMKTKWGSCNPKAGYIRLNTDLAKKPRQCLEYILVHEMVHLLEPTHNSRFVSLMDLFLPNWKSCRETLNRLPVRHETWNY